MYTKNKLTLEEQLYRLGLLFILLGSVLILIYIIAIHPYVSFFPCPLWEILGIYCPGCGGTRAVMALLQGKILASLWYHPLVLYTAVMFGGFMLTHTMEKFHVLHIKGWKFHDWYLYAALGVIIINWILKNVLLWAFNITL